MINKIILTSLGLFWGCVASAQTTPLNESTKTVLFLGDSITHAGDYISLIDAHIRLNYPELECNLINLGLPSETCSGLSEPDHPFPRPDVHERLDRALAYIKPDLVVACYGMNDGIYYPFSQDRFQAYKDGVNKIIAKVKSAGAKLILMTPPAFDPLPLQKKGKLLPVGAEKYAWFSIYEGYDSVLERYASWIMEQSDRVLMTVDLHTPVNAYTAQKRTSNPDFTMSPDGVHVNFEGHTVLANTILKVWGLHGGLKPQPSIFTLVQQRQRMLHDSLLSTVGHKRPGMKAGIPIIEATTQGNDLLKQVKPRVIVQRHRATRNEDGTHYVHFPASAKPGELSLFADYYLWIPPGVKKIRGVIVHQHGCGLGASTGGLTAAFDLHWRALAQKWNCALMGPSYEARAGASCRLWCDPRNGSDRRFQQALEHFSRTTGYSELSKVPWCLWGHSGGAFWASLMHVTHPERIVSVWLQSGTAYGYWIKGEITKPEIPELAYEVPVMGCPGGKEKDHERFHVAWDGTFEMMQAYRAHNAPFGFAPDPRTGHECGDSRYLAIPYFDKCMSGRLSDPADDTYVLRRMNRANSWLASIDGKDLIRESDFEGDRSTMAWLPDESFAGMWREFITTGAVTDSTPPGSPGLTSVSRVNGRLEIRVSCQADFESGIGAIRIERDGQPIAVLPEKPNRRFGRPLFQGMSYHDTPELPLPAFVLTDPAPQESATIYSVIAINGAGLESKPTEFKVPNP